MKTINCALFLLYGAFSALADHQPAVRLRWSYRIIKTGARPMSGWNIDDVEVLADAAPVIVVPRLDIQLTQTNTVWLSWPTNSVSFALQQNSDLTTTNWMDVASTVSVVGTNNEVSLPQSSRNEFFRLKLP